jgi:hypothetical protein
MLQRNKRDERTASFPASGTLAITIGPIPMGPSWEIKQISIRSSSVLETTAATYIGVDASGVFISRSFTGNADTDSAPNVTLRPGDSVSCVWEGGTPGAVATLTIIYDEVAY